MNTTQQTIMFDCNSDLVLDSEMANLLQMTNKVLLKIKHQTKGYYIWPCNLFKTLKWRNYLKWQAMLLWRLNSKQGVCPLERLQSLRKAIPCGSQGMLLSWVSFENASI